MNVVLLYFYLGLLVTRFILSLGYRLQGSKLAFTLAIIGFALITMYMMVVAFLLAFKGIEAIATAGLLGISDSAETTNAMLRDLKWCKVKR